MPKASLKLLKGTNYWYKNFGEILVNAISQKVVSQGQIMLVHCTSYSGDRQVMQFSLPEGLSTIPRTDYSLMPHERRRSVFQLSQLSLRKMAHL